MTDHATTPVTLTFDRLPGGGWVAMHTHEGRTVAACVLLPTAILGYRWALAGEITDHADRPQGGSDRSVTAMAEAAAALGLELGVDVTGYEVTP